MSAIQGTALPMRDFTGSSNPLSILVLVTAILGSTPYGAIAIAAQGADAVIPPCPATPNCVSSRANDSARRVDALSLQGVSIEVAQAELTQIIQSMDGASIVQAAPGHIQAEFTSSVFGFVDDVDVVFDEANGIADIRSASRVGYWDLGANRRRVETIRAALSIRLKAL